MLLVTFLIAHSVHHDTNTLLIVSQTITLIGWVRTPPAARSPS